MVKHGWSDEIISEATGYADTQNNDVLEAREFFAQRLADHKDQAQKQAELVKQAGGLYILGTERHESRRIDNQLRGRSGRQGDPGESTFFISLEDDLMRLFGSDRVQRMMDALQVGDEVVLDYKMMSSALRARSAGGRPDFQTRKSVLEYDDVMNRQREIIYGQRSTVLNEKISISS